MPLCPARGIVVCPEPLAAQAGGRMLEKGGNAVDAAVAAAFAQGVVNPMMCGLGGTGGMMVHRALDQTTVLVEAQGGAGGRARPDSYHYAAPSIYSNRYVVEGFENYVGHKAAMIPTIVCALGEAHARFGQLPWRDLLQPAIDLAENGFEVYPYIYRFWDPSRDGSSDSPPARIRLHATAECTRIYLRNGQPYAVGEVLAQSDYANTLRRIAEEGAQVFYRGDIALAIATDLQAHGGLVTLQDLECCTARARKPIYGRYRGYDIAAGHPPGMGPFEIEALNILENMDLHSLGWQSARYLDVMARVFQAIYADRVQYSADPLFENVPVDMLISKQHAKDLADQIGRRAEIPGAAAAIQESSTTHVSVLDRWGNAAALTQSNGDSSGAVTPGLGFMYNNHMHMFDPRPGLRNSTAPGKRAQSGCSPIMLFRDGAIRLISGSLTRFKVTGELHALVSLLDFGIDLQTAVEHPRVHAEYDSETLYVESSVSQSVLAELQSMGWKIKVVQMNTPLCIIVIDPQQGTQAAIDWRGGGGHWVQT